MQSGISSLHQVLQEQRKQAGSSLPTYLGALGLALPSAEGREKRGSRSPCWGRSEADVESLATAAGMVPEQHCRLGQQQISLSIFCAASLKVQLSMDLDIDLGLADQT